MSYNEILYCLVAFILGWLASRMMGNGFSVGGNRRGHRHGRGRNDDPGRERAR